MPKIEGDIAQFLRDRGAVGIPVIPQPGPNQRGPSCGFYALAFVMNYWKMRSETYGGGYAAEAAPLPARTNIDGPVDKDPMAQAQRDLSKRQGVFTSLRQYGKFKNLTAFGSVFNAHDLLAVARGKGSQYGDRYDGKVIAVTPYYFGERVRNLLEFEVPVIVPYDATGDGGEPGKDSGNSAHWVVIIGVYTQGNVDYAVYFTWGDFYYARLDDFGVSNDQLTSNEYLQLTKTEVVHYGQVVARDYMSAKTVAHWQKGLDDVKENIARLRSELSRPRLAPFLQELLQRELQSWESLDQNSWVAQGPKVHNPEFNDPRQRGLQGPKLDDMDGRNRLQVGGLRNRAVVVFRAEDRPFLTGKVPFLA